MEKQAFIVDPNRNPRWRSVLDSCMAAMSALAEAGAAFRVVIDDLVRTLDQNAAMWPALRDITQQVPWVVTMRNGATRAATEDDWKDILTAAFEEETEWAPGLRGGVVMLGARTSKYSRKKMGEFLTFVHAEGAERGVVWSEKAQDKFAEFIDRRAAS